jgi:hypothetical protein
VVFALCLLITAENILHRESRVTPAEARWSFTDDFTFILPGYPSRNSLVKALNRDARPPYGVDIQ